MLLLDILLDIVDVDLDVRKVKEIEKSGADILMKLGTDGDFLKMRKSVWDAISLPVSSVPLYQAFIEATKIMDRFIIWQKMNYLKQQKNKIKLVPVLWQFILE